mmetsp:Transcript_11504/g.10292  ORF Transcript_11504/g.10292 Transcript_11504/m.10292 type:complete len:186 (+) Transcript_11504:50-607(+)
MAMQQYTAYAQNVLILPDDMEKYRREYESVLKAVNSIPPKSRTVKKTHEVVVCEWNQLEEVGKVLAEACGEEISIKDVNDAMKNAIKMAKLKVKKYAKVYSAIQISGEWGGTSNCEFGLVGMKKISSDEYAIGVSMYKEVWVEQSNVKINLDSPIWREEHVKKFLCYQLHNELTKQMYKAALTVN